MTDKELDDLFQKTFAEHEMPVPSGMWDRVNPHEERRRRGAFFWWSGLGMAALLMITGTAVWLYHTSSQKALIAAKTTVEQTPAISGENDKDSSGAPSHIAQQKEASNPTADKAIPSRSVLADNNIHNYPQGFSSGQHNDRRQSESVHQKVSLSGNQITGSIGKSGKNKEGIQNSDELNSDKTNKMPELLSSMNQTETVPSSDQSATSLNKPNSTTAITGTLAKPVSKSASIKIKKIHGEKAASLELMVAGYDNTRNVYDVQEREPGIVSFGAAATKEKVLIHSASLNARIDKPLTRHFSLKTGLQFMQTRQRISYSYETVNQSTVVSSFNVSDTIRSARLQSERPVVRGVYNSINIPVLLSYHTGGAKLSIGATAGVLFNIHSWYRGVVPDAGYKQTIAAKDAFRTRTGASIYAGVTAAKRVGSFQLFVEPHAQYTLSSVTKSATQFRQKITGYGIGIGIRKTIGK